MCSAGVRPWRGRIQCRNWTLEGLCAVLELDAGGVVCSAGAYQEEHTRLGGRPLPPAGPVQHPVPTSLNILLTGKGKISEGSKSSFAEKAVELIGH